MPQKSRISSFKSILATAVALGLGSQAQAFDLSTAAREALVFDSTFRSAQKKADADATRFGQGLGLLLPAAVATASRSRTDFDAESASLTDTKSVFGNTYTVSLTQPIFRIDRLAVFNQERLRSKAGEANFAQARIDALLRVTQAYFDVLVAQDSMASVEAELKAIGQQLESAKRAFEVGTATVTDQQEAQARFDLATAKQIATKNDLDVKRNVLAQLVGKPVPQRLMGLKTDVKIASPEPLEVDKWVDQARTANLRVQAAVSAASIATSELVRVTSADNLPSVDLVARKTRIDPYRAGGLPPYERADTDVVSVEVTVPLFNGGIAYNRTREAMALKDKAQFDLESERRAAEQLARNAFLGVLAGLSQVRAFEAAEKSSRLALESNQLGYEVGVRINIDVLNAQQQLFTTQRDLSKARYDTIFNSLRLKSAVGTLSEKDIDEINGLLAKASQ